MRGLLSLPVTRVFLFLVVILIAYSAFTRYQIASEMAERREQAEIDVRELQVQKARLEQKVDYLSTERGIESELRRQFDVTLPGEEVIVILEDEEEELLIEPLSSTTTKGNPWYIFWD